VTPNVERLLPLVEPVLSAIRVLSLDDTRPEAARALLTELLRALRLAGEKAGISAKDLDDTTYALAALADEAMLARPGTREAWLTALLQMSLFRENTAGTGFYTRLEELRRDPTRADVLLVYYLALALGFRGRFEAEDELRRLELLECVHLDLLRAGAASEAPLAPSWRRPRTSIARRIEGRVVLACGAVSLVLATGLWLVFELDLLFRVAAALHA
jgi:type VI secretion system protein ImpK